MKNNESFIIINTDTGLPKLGSGRPPSITPEMKALLSRGKG